MSMQVSAPYRIPLQPSTISRCNDRSTCLTNAPRVSLPERRLHPLALAILAALFAGSIPLAFAMGRESRMDVAPPAVANDAHSISPRTLPARAPLANVAFKPRHESLLADGVTHDPMTLLQRTRALIDAGTPITLAFVDVDRVTRDRLRYGQGLPVIDPWKDSAGTVEGIVIGTLVSSSPLRTLGFETNDVILSVNGYRPTDDLESLYDTQPRDGSSGHALVELLRDGSRIVLNLWWSGT